MSNAATAARSAAGSEKDSLSTTAPEVPPEPSTPSDAAARNETPGGSAAATSDARCPHRPPAPGRETPTRSEGSATRTIASPGFIVRARRAYSSARAATSPSEGSRTCTASPESRSCDARASASCAGPPVVTIVEREAAGSAGFSVSPASRPSRGANVGAKRARIRRASSIVVGSGTDGPEPTS